MATSAIGGSYAHLKVSNDGVTYVELGEITNLNDERNAPAISANHHDEPVFNSNIPGRIQNVLSGTVNYVYNNAGQILVETAQTNRTFVYFKLMPKETAGLDKYTGRGVISRFAKAFPDGGVATSDFSLDVDGTVTKGTIVGGGVDIP